MALRIKENLRSLFGSLSSASQINIAVCYQKKYTNYHDGKVPHAVSTGIDERTGPDGAGVLISLSTASFLMR